MGKREQGIGGRALVCVAHGHRGDWEAFCLDFDLAVQGISLEDVRSRLEEVLADYVHAASEEAEPARSRLLNRRAPCYRRRRSLRISVPEVVFPSP